MDTFPFDFVSALSAEEQCPVCKELHAAVDECLCADCSTHVCRDCSSLQPDTSWICKPCAARTPSRAYPAVTARPAWSTLQHARHALREQASLWLREAGPFTQRALLALRSLTVAALAFSQTRLRSLRDASAAALREARPRLQDLTVRSRDVSVRSFAFLDSRARLTARRAYSGSASAVQLVRTWPLRAQTTSLLLAMMILIAVARAENSPEA